MKAYFVLLLAACLSMCFLSSASAEDPMILTFLKFDNSASMVDDAALAQVRGSASGLDVLTCDQCRALVGYLLYISLTYEAPPCPTCPTCGSCPTCIGYPSGTYVPGYYYGFEYSSGGFAGTIPDGEYYCVNGNCSGK